MANTYGDTTEPGIITEETSSGTIVSADEAPSDACIVGQADLVNGTATANTVYEITRDDTARTRFGAPEDSLLTSAILDMLREGATPVYAIATSETSVAGEDISGVAGTSGTLANAPVSEDPADTSFVVDGVTKTTVITFEDPATKSPGSGEVYFRPTDAKFELDAAPGDADNTNDTVDYTHFDYVSALNALEANREAADAVDFVSALAENDTVQQDVITTVDNLAQNQQYAVALVSAGARVDPSTYANPHDSSRVQTAYPTRFEDGTSALAAYAGKRASIGLEKTPIGQRFETEKPLAVSLSKAQRGDLIAEKVVPLEDRAGGAVIKDDPTSIADTNTAEANLDYGFKRLVLDYVYDITRENEEPFIGKLNRRAVRNALADLIAYELTALKESHLIEAYSVNVSEDTATHARLELTIDAPDPLRFITNDVTIGTTA